MLEGVTVLETIETMEQLPAYQTIGCVIFFVGFIVGICLVSVLVDANANDVQCTCIPVAVILVYATVGMLVTQTKVPTGEYQYRCTIEDNVTFNELTEHYDIIDVNDKIVTLQEKE